MSGFLLATIWAIWVHFSHQHMISGNAKYFKAKIYNRVDVCFFVAFLAIAPTRFDMMVCLSSMFIFIVFYASIRD